MRVVHINITLHKWLDVSMFRAGLIIIMDHPFEWQIGNPSSPGPLLALQHTGTVATC